MALKKKGAANISGRKATMPKAGPKKQRAKSEAELIRDAVEEHGKRGLRPRRKASKVNTFTYKDGEAAKRKRGSSYVHEQERVFQIREPHGPSEFDMFKDELSDEQRVFAKAYWQMRCEHTHERPGLINPSLVNGVTPVMMTCPDCGLVRRWHGNRTATKLQEWISYCPDGYDMFDWMDLYVRDRLLWQFIHDECLAEMVSETMLSDDEEDA